MAKGICWEMLCDALRRENHTFMNDLQVIGGWLQLGNSQRAMEYIEETKNRVRRQSCLMNYLGPRLYGLLCAVKMRAEAAGVSVTIQYPDVFDRDEWETSAKVGDALSHLIKVARGEGFTQVEIGLAPGPGANRYIIRLLGGRLNSWSAGEAFSALSLKGFRVRAEEVSGLPAIIVERA